MDHLCQSGLSRARHGVISQTLVIHLSAPRNAGHEPRLFGANVSLKLLVLLLFLFGFGFCFLLLTVWGERYVATSKGVTNIKANIVVT